jgi:hypothetical protein
MEAFHKKVSNEYSNGEQGYQAFLYFRSLLERRWKDSDSNVHPFGTWVRFSSEYHYTRLIQLRRRFELVERVDGFRARARRLADKEEYLSAKAEIETAARLKMAGVDVSFPKADGTPDILTNVEGGACWVEVACVNPAPLESKFSDLIGEVMGIMMSKRVTIGGLGLERLDKNDIQLIKDKVNVAAEEIRGKNEIRTVNVPGKATLYVGAGTKTTEIPEEYRGGFRVWSKSPRPHIERVMGKIQEKGAKEYVGGGHGFLVLYDSLMDARTLGEIFANPTDDLGLIMATCPQIFGMALIVQSDPGARISPLTYLPTPEREFKEYALPDMTSENLIVRKNRYPDVQQPSMIFNAFTDYPTNYAKYLNERNRLNP